LTLPADTIIIRLELTSGGRTRLDYISLELDASAGVGYRAETWGRIKALWR
jgi:hypothetical protein